MHAARLLTDELRAKRPSRETIAALRRRLEGELGPEAVVADPDLLERYGEDWSGAKGVLPDLVVKARSTADVQATLRAAVEHRVPVTPRGLGTGKSGGCIPVCGGVVLSLERMARVKEIDRDNLWVIAEPGVITADLMAAVATEGLFYPPDPNSARICSIGGNVACNAGGPRALKYGVTKHYVLGMEAVLADGQRLSVGKRTVKHVTGYDLAGLLVGSEGTLAVITEVSLRLLPEPAAVQTALISFAQVAEACRAVSAIIAAGIIPRTLELLDDEALRAVETKTPGRFPADAGALLILETDGATPERAFADLERAAEIAGTRGALDVRVAQDEAQREKIWEPRRVLSVSLSETAPKKISEDVVVPRSAIPALVEAVRRIAKETGVRCATYGHAGDGNLHVNVLFDEATEGAAHRAVRAVLEATLSLGGTISGEHGIGLLKRDFLALEHAPPLIAAQRALKQALDPLGLLNPGKILPGGGPTE